MSEFLNDKELQAFENDLKNLLPLAPTLDRDRLLFRAGQESMRGQRRLWMISSATLSVGLACVSTALLWLLQLPPVERVKVVIVERPQEAMPAVPTAPRAESREMPAASYLQLRSRVLRLGVEAVPGVPAAPPTVTPAAQADTLLALHKRAAPRSLLQWFTGPSGETE